MLSGTPAYTDAGVYSDIRISIDDQMATATLPAFDITVLADTDNDGIPNVNDPDDDNDGLIDIYDGCPLDPQGFVDTDSDGYCENTDLFPNDPTEWLDTDLDSVGDNADAFPTDPAASIDTDGDGYPDTWNVGRTQAESTTGLSLDAFPADPSEWSDADGDGVGDNTDVFPSDPTETVDFDKDGIGDNADIDDDNDGYLDIEDAFPFDPVEWIDTDNDGIGNNTDTDDDNDGVLDKKDAFPTDPTESADFDNDGIGDNSDSDDDNDGINDTLDAFPLDSSEWLDTDSDGVGDNSDDFVNDPAASIDSDGDGYPDEWNAGMSQADSTSGLTLDAFPYDPAEVSDNDGDGIGDNADVDDDNDGVVDWVDSFPSDPSASVDIDEDGYPDSWNTGSSQADSTTGLTLDAFPNDPTEWVDTDGDGIGNNTDADDDNDGFADLADPNPLTVNANISYAGVQHMTWADGSEVDSLELGIQKADNTSLGDLTATVTGPNGFSYTFTDSDAHPWGQGLLALWKQYDSLNPLEPGTYTFTVTDSLGNSVSQADLHIDPHPVPIVNESTVQYQRLADGTYRFRWAPVNAARTYYYRFRIYDSTAEDAVPVFKTGRMDKTWVDVPAGTLTDG
ncbi:MAG: hypothetical protein D6698_00160, partial [Gammaproteobacteria bacterium]